MLENKIKTNSEVNLILNRQNNLIYLLLKNKYQNMKIENSI